jgi:transglutaminase-like putative cysteine protease
MGMKIRRLIIVPMIILLLLSATGCGRRSMAHRNRDEIRRDSSRERTEETTRRRRGRNSREDTRDNSNDDSSVDSYNESIDNSNVASTPSWGDADGYTYYYDLLSEGDKELYTEIYNAIVNYSDGIDINVSKDELDRCYNSVTRDHPELYYVNRYTYTYDNANSSVMREFIPEPDYSEENVKSRQAEIDSVVESFMQSAPVNGSEYEKVKYIYEYVCDMATYDTSATSNQTVYDALVSRRCVCNGYATSVKYLCDKLGVKSIYVAGSGLDENNRWQSHAWNMVNINNKWYAVDATWGDKKIEGDGIVFSDYMYDYLCANDDVVFVKHKNDDFITYPSCTSDDLDYYKSNGIYLSDISDESIRKVFREVQKDSGGYVILKCASESMVKELETKLIDESGIFDYINELSAKSLTYDDMNLVVFYW